MEPVRLHHPFRSTSYNSQNIDSIGLGIETIKDEIEQLRRLEMELRIAANQLVQADGPKTQRLVGQAMTLEVVRQDDVWSQPTLKQIVKDWDPVYWNPYLRIATWAVNIRDFKKMLTASGHVDFERFKATLASARSDNNSPPYVRIRPRDEIKAGAAADTNGGQDTDDEDLEVAPY